MCYLPISRCRIGKEVYRLPGFFTGCLQFVRNVAIYSDSWRGKERSFCVTDLGGFIKTLPALMFEFLVSISMAAASLTVAFNTQSHKYH
jgi:hypothetical protein